MFRARARGARGPWLLLGVVLAVLLACAAPATAQATAQAGAGAGAQARAVRTGVVQPHLAEAHTAGRAPSCAPGPAERGPLPAAPARGAGDQGQVPPARITAERSWDGRATAARVLVRGPDRPAPSPLELSVMRV